MLSSQEAESHLRGGVSPVGRWPGPSFGGPVGNDLAVESQCLRQAKHNEPWTQRPPPFTTSMLPRSRPGTNRRRARSSATSHWPSQ